MFSGSGWIRALQAQGLAVWWILCSVQVRSVRTQRRASPLSRKFTAKRQSLEYLEPRTVQKSTPKLAVKLFNLFNLWWPQNWYIWHSTSFRQIAAAMDPAWVPAILHQANLCGTAGVNNSKREANLRSNLAKDWSHWSALRLWLARMACHQWCQRSTRYA